MILEEKVKRARYVYKKQTKGKKNPSGTQLTAVGRLKTIKELKTSVLCWIKQRFVEEQDILFLLDHEFELK